MHASEKKRKRRSETVVEHTNHGNLTQSDAEDDLKEGEQMKPESYCDICSKRRKREESVRVGAVEDDEEIDD